MYDVVMVMIFTNSLHRCKFRFPRFNALLMFSLCKRKFCEYFSNSSPLIPLFESWLRLVLERNSKIRGGEKDQNGERLCYRLAEKILNTKVNKIVFYKASWV